MKSVGSLSCEEEAALERLHREGATHRERVRAQAVLLSSRGMSLKMLSTIFEVDRDTVSGWLDRFLEGGVAHLRDAPKPGRPSKLSPAARQMLHEALFCPTPRLAPVVLERLKKGA